MISMKLKDYFPIIKIIINDQENARYLNSTRHFQNDVYMYTLEYYMAEKIRAEIFQECDLEFVLELKRGWDDKRRLYMNGEIMQSGQEASIEYFCSVVIIISQFIEETYANK